MTKKLVLGYVVSTLLPQVARRRDHASGTNIFGHLSIIEPRNLDQLNFRCFVPLCDGQEKSYEETWLNFSIPKSDKNNFLKEEEDFDKCKMYQAKPGSTKCHRDSFYINSTVTCNHFVYENATFEETASTVLNMVCDDSYKATFQGTVLMLGLMVGCIVGGPLADKNGRRKTLIIATGILGPSTILGGFIPNFAAFSLLRFTTFTSISIIWIAGHTQLMELFDSKWRKLAYLILSLSYGLSNLITPLIGYLERDWKYMHLYAGLIVITAFPLVVFCLVESIRWQILNGEAKSAEKLLLSVAKINGKRKLTEYDLFNIRHIIKVMDTQHSEAEKKTGKLSPRDMFRRKFILRTLITLSIWITSVVSFYALALNATELAGDIFLNHIYGLLAELPTTFVVYLLIDHLGRKFTMFIALLISGSSLITMAFVPKASAAAIMALWLIGRIGSTCTLNVVWFYTAEIYPTNMRAQAIATCSMTARIFGAIAPFIIRLNEYDEIIPFLVIGIPVIASGLAAIALPETKGHTLPEVIHDEMKVEGGGDDEAATELTPNSNAQM